MMAMGGCSGCGQTICGAHTVMGPNGPACPQCANSQPGYEQNEDTVAAATRGGYYQQYGKPGYFSKQDESSLNNKKLERDDDFET
jgi:hypothetical protein